MNIFAEAIQKRQTPAILNKATSWALKDPLAPSHPFLRNLSKSGVRVSSETALTLSAYFQGINLLSNHLAMLPFKVYRPQEAGSNNNVAVNDHSVTQRLHYEADSATMTAFQARKAMNVHMLNWGNGFAKIERRGNEITALKVVKPWKMRVLKDPDTDELYYFINGDDKTYRWWEILHVHQFSKDGLIGVNVVEHFAKERLGGHIAAEKYGESFFGNGTHMGGMLVSKESFGNNKVVADAAKSEIRQELEMMYNGPENFLKIGIFDGDMDYKPLHLKASDVQLIERMKFTVDDVSRWLNIPPHKLNSLERSTNNNIEHQSIEYVQDSILPRATMWEQEVRRRMLTESEKRQGYFMKMIINALMRGDVKTRGEFYQNMLDRGVFTPNDVLRLEDMNTYPEGNKHMMPMNHEFVEDKVNGVSNDTE